MFEIILFKDKRNRCPIYSYISDLESNSRNNKEKRIKYCKIIAYINKLQQYGTKLCMPVARHLDGPLWELRPVNDRIIYAFIDGQKIILLHVFRKTTQKTPKREILQAKKNLEIYLESEGANNEKGHDLERSKKQS